MLSELWSKSIRQINNTMKIQLLQDLKKGGLPPLISFNPHPMIGKKLGENNYSLKAEIKTQLWEDNIKTILIYVLIFITVSNKSLLKFLILLKNILKGQNLNTVPHCFNIMKNILSKEFCWFFKQKYWENVNTTTTEYELVMQGQTTHFFTPKAL